MLSTTQTAEPTNYQFCLPTRPRHVDVTAAVCGLISYPELLKRVFSVTAKSNYRVLVSVVPAALHTPACHFKLTSSPRRPQLMCDVILAYSPPRELRSYANYRHAVWWWWGFQVITLFFGTCGVDCARVKAETCCLESFIHYGAASLNKPKPQATEAGEAAALRNDTEMCFYFMKKRQETLLTQKMKLKKKSMYLIHLVQPSTPMVADVFNADFPRRWWQKRA